MPEQLTEIVLGIVVDNYKKVLIVEREKKEQGTGGIILSWAFPGGKLETNENIKTAITREVAEETGYEVEVGKMISERTHPQFPVHITYLACTPKRKLENAKIDTNEITQHQWVQPSQLQQYITTDIDPNVSKYLGLPTT